MKCIGVLTSGGDSPGMNAAVRAVVRRGLSAGLRVVAIRRGFSGLLEGRFEEMDWRSVSGLINRGGSFIECARSPEMYTAAGPEEAARILKRRCVDGLVVVGGDGSFRGALALEKNGARVIGLTGTIDNDIIGTVKTIGFDTACDTLSWCINQLRDTAASHLRTFVIEAMGRHSGWLALAAGIAGGADVILIPEIEWKREDVLATIRKRHDEGRTFNLVVIAEGAGRATDLTGWLNAQTAEEIEVRACIPGHIQRGGMPSTADRVFATRCGVLAVEALLAGKHGIMIGEDHGEMVEVPLEVSTAGNRLIDRALYDLAVQIA